MCKKEDIWFKVISNIKEKYTGYDIDDMPSFCWLWTGSTSGDGRGGGYGRMALGGTTMAVHRVIWTNEYGIIPHKKQIDHKCKQRLCCNPSHLKLVTHKENQKRRKKP